MAAHGKRGLDASKTRSSGMKGSGRTKTKRTAAQAPRPPQIVGEKSVRRTSSEVGVKPLKQTRESRKPMDDRAIDRRTQVFDRPAK